MTPVAREWCLELHILLATCVHIYGYRVAAFTVGIGPYGEWMFVTMPEPRKRKPVDTNTMQGNIQLYDI